VLIETVQLSVHVVSSCGIGIKVDPLGLNCLVFWSYILLPVQSVVNQNVFLQLTILPSRILRHGSWYLQITCSYLNLASIVRSNKSWYRYVIWRHVWGNLDHWNIQLNVPVSVMQETWRFDLLWTVDKHVYAQKNCKNLRLPIKMQIQHRQTYSITSPAAAFGLQEFLWEFMERSLRHPDIRMEMGTFWIRNYFRLTERCNRSSHVHAEYQKLHSLILSS
jgi:hypothetical protein